MRFRKKAFEPHQKEPRVHSIYGFDIETEGAENRFLMASVSCPDGSIKSFFNQDKCKEFLLSPALDKARIYATNLQFDFFGLFGMIADDRMKVLFSGNRLIMISINPDKRRKGATRTFCDTINILPASVEQLGNILKIPKMKKPSFLGKRPKNKQQWDYLEKYNRIDADISRRFAQYIQDNFNRIGMELRYTTASSALWIFQKRFMTKPMYQPDENTMQSLRMAYYGGRTECFKAGRFIGLYKVYDVNSLYPFSMENEFPDSSSLQDKLIDAPFHIIERYHGVSYCHIKSPKTAPYYPLLPFRDETGRLIFPVGEWDGYYSHIELREARRLGYEITPRTTWYYTKSYYPFKSFVDFFYGLRLSDKENSVVWKLCLNSLYGKFGQSWDDSYKYVPMDSLSRLPAEFVMELCGWAMLKEVDKEPPLFANVIYSLYTTAYGRLHLHKLLEKSKAVYCDTDSIFTKDAMPVGTALGDLKLEAEVSGLVVVKPKLYKYRTAKGEVKIKTKGFRLTSEDEFMSMLSEPVVHNIRFGKFKSVFRTERKMNEVYSIMMELNLNDRKREWPLPFSKHNLMDSRPITIGRDRG